MLDRSATRQTAMSSDYAAGGPRKELPPYVILEADWGGKVAGTVLRADADLIGQLEVEGVPFRPANPQERGIAGFVD
jgi:hypothetical protein